MNRLSLVLTYISGQVLIFWQEGQKVYKLILQFWFLYYIIICGLLLQLIKKRPKQELEPCKYHILYNRLIYIYNTLASNESVSLTPVYIIISDSSSFILSTLVTTPSLPSLRSGASIPLPTDTAWAPSASAL